MMLPWLAWSLLACWLLIAALVPASRFCVHVMLVLHSYAHFYDSSWQYSRRQYWEYQCATVTTTTPSQEAAAQTHTAAHCPACRCLHRSTLAPV